MNDRLHNLDIEYQRKKHQIEKEQFSCNHCWSQPQYDPEIQKKPTGYEIVAQGSDIYILYLVNTQMYKYLDGPEYAKNVLK